MHTTTTQLDEHLTALEELTHATNQTIEQLLALATDTDPADQDAAAAVLRAADLVGRGAQALNGQLIRILAQAHRIKANQGGLTPWLTTHLDVTKGAARGIAQSAREIGLIPELAEPLASGRFGTATIRALTRTARAVKGTDLDLTESLTAALTLSAEQGVGAANKQVRILEETVDPGRAGRLLEKQRSRSFLRVLACESGMYRIEALLDPQRANEFKAVLDQTVAAWLRARQYDHTEQAGQDTYSVEQLQAHALVRFAQVFATTDSKQRGAEFTPGTIYHAPLDPNTNAGLVESVYGDHLPRTVLAPLGNPAAHLIEHDSNGQPILLDGQQVDQNPAARLASSTQRTALGWRDRTCRHPGCSRPPTWALHAHHITPYSKGGPTVMKNLALYCTEHHTLTHHPGR